MADAPSTTLILKENMARPRRFERPTFAFGGQRSIQLSYGRLSVLNKRNGPTRQRALFCSIGWCVKAPAAKVGRSNRLGRASNSRAEGVPGALSSPCNLVHRLATYKRTSTS